MHTKMKQYSLESSMLVGLVMCQQAIVGRICLKSGFWVWNEKEKEVWTWGWWWSVWLVSVLDIDFVKYPCNCMMAAL